MIQTTYKIIKYILLSVVVLIICIMGVYAVKKIITKDKTSSIFGYSFYHVRTSSMSPDIRPGDLVVVKKRNEYCVGMDVTYQIKKTSTPVTHRIKEINGNEVITYGINNDGIEDLPIDVSCIVGEVIYIWENYYDFINFVTSPIGLILLSGGVFIIIYGFELMDRFILKKNEVKDV